MTHINITIKDTIENKEDGFEKTYSLKFFEDKIWLVNEDYEGMGISEKELFDIFDKFFKENY